MSRPTVEVAHILHAQGDRFLERNRSWLGIQRLSVLRAISRCRTAALGGHIDSCSRCGHQAISYNSCRNRHCQYNPKVLYDLLFQVTAATLLEIAADPKHLGAEIGFLTILHTWGQNLLPHPHLHCVIPMGGLSPDHTRWVHPRYLFFLPIGVLKRVFRRRFVKALKLAYRQKKLRYFGQIAEIEHPKRFAD